ncbi:MlaD family protein [Nocardioides daeguensis]|uniref:Mce/MlaD domain-containing protein n=1 Tax=Nocardioides daeguensis TaxID=908359 RepID=A0ABP6UU20_9ACTN|nr:MlaD family protein [Nocardioides daeguensis]MBV6728237.1 MCE family protein [Nocardioides daeguensis]MCR1773047.1 MCE family protein [Nocardioides daeguensis]
MTTRPFATPSRWFAITLLAAALLSSGCALQPNDNTLPGQVAVGDDGYEIKVHFNQIENLVPNSTVQRDNVVIGTVGQIDVEGWEAVVDMHLLKSVPLPTDVTFSIGQKTLLGAQYVEVSVPDSSDSSETGGTEQVTRAAARPRGAMLEEGDVIGVDQTGTYPATEQILGAVALLLNNGGLSQISTITGELSTALRNKVPDTRGLIRHANELLAVLDSNRGEIVAALESLNNLSSGLREDQRSIATAIDRITPGLKVLETERTRLVSALTHAGRAGDRAVRVIRVSETALLANLDSLGPILTNLGRVSESLPEALKIAATIPFPAMTTTNILAGDYANLFATIDLGTTALAESWLGGLPPALQAGDPIENPLAPAPNPGAGDDVGSADSDTSDDDGEPTTPTPTEEPTSGCLLKLLGLC